MTQPAETSASTTGNFTNSPSPKHRFLEAYERNHANTLRVLKAFPADQSEFRPHERSKSALDLAWTLVGEEQFILRALRGDPVLGSSFPSPPDSWTAVLDAFNKGYDDIIAELRSPGNTDLVGTAHFFVAPKQTADIPLPDFLNLMLHDQIHHRGQFSVYVRMTGGKVPSIYGPSADEPWN